MVSERKPRDTREFGPCVRPYDASPSEDFTSFNEEDDSPKAQVIENHGTVLVCAGPLIGRSIKAATARNPIVVFMVSPLAGIHN